MSVNKLDTLEVSGTLEDIGFAIGQADTDSIQKQILQLAEFRETERSWQDSSYLKMLDAAVRSVFQNTFWILKEWPDAHRPSMKHSWSGTAVVICHCPMTQFRNPRNILRKAAQPSFILQQKVLLQ